MARKNGKREPGSPQNREKRRIEAEKRTRRKSRKNLFIALAVVIILIAMGGATLTFRSEKSSTLHDLSAIGRGVPAVVQVYDHTCPVCTELRGEVERIEEEFSDEQLIIRIADVHTDEGVAFAARYTEARRATLLYIDADGELVAEQSGAQTANALRRAFNRHVDGEL